MTTSPRYHSRDSNGSPIFSTLIYNILSTPWIGDEDVAARLYIRSRNHNHNHNSNNFYSPPLILPDAFLLSFPDLKIDYRDAWHHRPLF